MRNIAEDLRGTVDAAVPRLLEMTDQQASMPRDGGGWSPKQIIGHLIDSAANNHQRFVRLQFETALVLPGYQQDQWVDSQQYQQRPWRDLIELWRAYNLHLAHVLEHADSTALPNVWKYSQGDLTLEAVATDYPRHMRHHLDQIMAR
jgi:hypothetical protein